MPGYVWAAPIITSATPETTFSHGAVVDVTGSGFGDKGNCSNAVYSSQSTCLANSGVWTWTVAPLLWDPVDGMYSGITDGGTVPTGGTNPWNSSGGSGMNDPVFTTNPRGKFTHAYSNKAQLSGTGNAVLGGKAWPGAAEGTLYVTYWQYPHQDVSNPGLSNKYMQLTSDGGLSGNLDNATWGPGSNNIFTYSLSTGYTGQATQANTDTVGAWNRMEFVIVNNVSTKPKVIAKRNNVTAANFTSNVSLPNDITGIYTLGADWSGAQNATVPQLDWGEIYVDDSSMRVEICNAPTKAASNHCEVQIPQNTWNDGQLEIKVNQGSFADNAEAYLYVVIGGGIVNTNGFPITFDVGSSDTTPPAAPSGLSVL